MLEVPNGCTTETAEKTKNRERHDQDGKHGHFYVVRFDFLAEILRRSPDHQSGDEHREDHEDHHAVKSGTDAAKDDFAQA